MITGLTFFSFLQVRHFILTVKTETSQIERALSLGLRRRLIGFCYGTLRSTATVNALGTQRLWEADLGVYTADVDCWEM